MLIYTFATETIATANVVILAMANILVLDTITTANIVPLRNRIFQLVTMIANSKFRCLPPSSSFPEGEREWVAFSVAGAILLLFLSQS